MSIRERVITVGWVCLLVALLPVGVVIALASPRMFGTDWGDNG